MLHKILPKPLLPHRISPCSSTRYAFYLCLLLMIGYNLAFFSAVNQFTGLHKFTDFLFLLSTAILFGAVTYITLLLVTLPFLIRLVTPFLLVSSASAAYFASNYGVLFHEIMIQNLLETDPHEVRGLLNLKLGSYWLLLGIVPSVFFFGIKINYSSLWREIILRGKATLIAIGLIFGSVAPFTAEYYSFFHDHIAIRQQSIPLSFVYASISYTAGNARLVPNQPIKVIGEDAHINTERNTSSKPTLFILVLGEAARADHFSTNGYARPTITKTTQENILNFSNAWSCGTETAVSVPCMFSGLGKANYSERVAKSQESLLDLVQRAGYQVLWRDNNSGCKETCNRVQFENLAYHSEATLCEHGECYDDILLWELDKRVLKDKNQLIVLHQKGSHGPDYYNRVPNTAEIFKPICRENLLQNCSQEALINAYDNTIAYTDKILAQTIAYLKTKSTEYNTALLYLSDHGESLGEKNIYLHGLPYAIAPDAQKHIPMMIWLSEDFVQAKVINRTCLEERQHENYSQDYLYHSILGILDIETKIYNPSLDLFGPCRHLNSST